MARIESVTSTRPSREERPDLDDAPADVSESLAESAPTLSFPASLPLFVAAMELVTEAIVITDTEATIQYVNPAFTRISGYSPEEALGRNARLLKSGQQDPVYYRELWQTILSGKVWRGELLNRRKDGALYTALISITPVHDLSGHIANFIAIEEDVTDRRATEVQIQSNVKNPQEARHVATLGGWELDELASEFHASEGFLRIFDWPSTVGNCTLAEGNGSHPGK